MIRLLILVQVLDIVSRDIPRPLHVEQVRIVGFEHGEASCFTRVHHSVINMSRITNAERHEQVFYFLSSIHTNAICNSFDTHVRWILEKSYRRSAFENRFQESNLVRVWLENTIWQASLVFLQEFLV